MKNKTSITITLDDSAIRFIDLIADKENRNRSNVIETIIFKIASDYKKEITNNEKEN